MDENKLRATAWNSKANQMIPMGINKKHKSSIHVTNKDEAQKYVK